MQKTLVIFVSAILLFALILGLRFIFGGPEDTWLCQGDQWVKHGNPLAPMPPKPCGKGETEKKTIQSFIDCIEAGYPVLESYPRQCQTPDGKNFSEDIGNELEKQDLIQLNSPRSGEEIKSPLTIEGKARGFWFFEASFPIKIITEENELIAQGIAQAQEEWMTEDFVPFKGEVNFTVSSIERGWLILEKDNPSDLPENDDELRVPIILTPANKETTKVKVYFNNIQLDPEITCVKVFPIEREIPKTEAIGRAALEELLKGPTEQEKSEGFLTNINPGVKIQKLTIDPPTGGGVAKVDFDEQLEFQVGGSCRVAAISAQITQTLKQFPTVKSVIISINGRTEDILQP